MHSLKGARTGGALVSALLYWLPFNHPRLWPCAFVCWIPLLLAGRGLTWRGALALGTLQGAGCLVVTGWLVPTVRAFTGLGPVASGASVAAFALCHGLRHGVIAALFVRLRERGAPPALALPSCVVTCELAYPTLFPWYTAAQVASVPAWMQLAEVGGVLAVSGALALVNAVLLEALEPRRTASRRWASLVAGAALLGAGVVGGGLRIRAVNRGVARAPRASVGVVQTILEQGHPRGPALEEAAVASAALSAERPVDLLVWPETVADEVLDERALGASWDRTRKTRTTRTTQPSSPLLAGFVLRGAGPGGALTNSAILLDGGVVRGRYDKVRPLLFGENLPFADRFPRLRELLPNAGDVEPGEGPVTLRVAGHRVTPLVCYEDLLPDLARTAVAAGEGELLVDLTNDAWFGHSDAWAMHLALAKFRAVEHRRFLVRAANVAGTAIVDPAGRVVTEAEAYRPAALRGDVRWLEGRTIFEDVGDWPWRVVAALVVLTAARRRAGDELAARHLE